MNLHNIFKDLRFEVVLEEEEEVLPSTGGDVISGVEEREYYNFSTTTNAVMNLELAFVESEGMKKLYTNTEKVSC